MRLLLLIAVALPLAAHVVFADFLGRIRAEKVIHCGSTVRPGLAFPARDSTWHGLHVDLCRAVAVAIAGTQAQVDFHPYVLSPSYDAIRRGEDELFFLTASELLSEHLIGKALPGPPVFYLAHAILVPEGSPVHHISDLADINVCAEPGTGAERSLVAYFAAQHLPLHFFSFQEADEMLDAFVAGRCGAIAHEITSLAAIRLQDDEHPSRICRNRSPSFPSLPKPGLTKGRSRRWWRGPSRP